MPAVRGGRRSEVRRQHVDAVVEPSEPEVGEERRGERPVDAIREALVAGVGDAAERHELVAAALLSEDLRAVAQEVPEAVASEGVEPVAEPSVDAEVERVAVEGLRPRAHVIVDRAVLASWQVRRRHALQERERLLRETSGGNHVAAELLTHAGRAARGIVDVHAIVR